MRSTVSPIGNAICGKNSGASLLNRRSASDFTTFSRCSELSIYLLTERRIVIEILNRLHYNACLMTDTDLVTVDAETHLILGNFFRPKKTIG